MLDGSSSFVRKIHIVWFDHRDTVKLRNFRNIDGRDHEDQIKE